MRLLLATVVVVFALIASMVTGREIQAPPQPPPQPAAAVVAQELPVEKLGRRRTNAEVEDLFAIESWAPPKAVTAPVAVVEPAPPPQPAAPVAPPLPFAYLGRMIRNRTTLVYVLKGEEMLLLESGHAFGEYKVESIGESAMSFVHTPTGTRQSLSFPVKE